ncbi:hypothetical protein [Pseudomonas sp. NBRC 100443]|uniref:hypothetical protein n=1 Tax=Pseudomonas sp. NBRC 100443 TaxID=1113665 RepID=UPI0024A35C96|nr:hypothetical protein [Pseudomonas sp. NBRC 100443]GLU36571.1 hypothetical protein Pssp01_06640 [Pseudomonas sp. NBRC 100443]GLU36580.1 hypothetical protein Pssp01_06730 [Pseudomonas sp. NBRC 100443]
MNAVAAVLVAIFTRVAAFLAQRLGYKFTIRMMVATAWLAAAAAFVVAVTALQGGLYVMAPGWVQDALDLLPNNTTACIACIAATYAAAWTYQEITTLITIKGKV